MKKKPFVSPAAGVARKPSPPATGQKPVPQAPRPFDKYFYYLNSVQDPEGNMAFLRNVYLELRGHVPRDLTLREDFCGSFANACAWVGLGAGYVAHGIDIDPEPIAYGREHYAPKLTSEQQARLSIVEGDVLKAPLANADVVAALNFAACFFHTRAELKAYCVRVRESLKPGGVFVLDLMGGAFYEDVNEHETEIEDPEDFSYFLEQEDYDPLNRIAKFKIHYKRKGEPKRKDVFSYTFRMWTPPELKDVLLDCGFADVRYYWEGTAEDGDGDEVWSLATVGDSCDSWHAYIVGLV